MMTVSEVSEESEKAELPPISCTTKSSFSSKHGTSTSTNGVDANREKTDNPNPSYVSSCSDSSTHSDEDEIDNEKTKDIDTTTTHTHAHTNSPSTNSKMATISAKTNIHPSKETDVDVDINLNAANEGLTKAEAQSVIESQQNNGDKEEIIEEEQKEEKSEVKSQTHIKSENNIKKSRIIKIDAGVTSHGESQEELSNRVKSLESQLETLSQLLTNVLKNTQAPGTPPNIPQVPSLERVSSMILHDSTTDFENESGSVEGRASPQKSHRAASPTPTLEYRSYTPTYEEELLKYRKSSRGMSIDDMSRSGFEIIDSNKLVEIENKTEINQKIVNVVDEKPPLQKSPDHNKKNGISKADDKTFCLEKDDTETTKLLTIEKTQNNETSDNNKKNQKTRTDDIVLSLNKNGPSIVKVNATEKEEPVGIFKSKTQAIMAFFNSLNIDSRQHDGSAAEDVDANMEEFLRVPYRIEELMSFGIIICADAFLHVLTVTPLKFVWSCLCLICTILIPGKGIGLCSFHRRHLYQFVRVFVIYAVYKYCLSPISIGKMYHWIRGQAMLKLYVLMAMVEVFDRLMCSFGQDALDSLFWNTTRRPYHPRMILSIVVVLVYAIIHSYILFVHVATLNVAMNSADQTLLTLIISGNFAEIKSTVFKKYNKQNLFKIVTSDICERFKLVLFLGLVLLLNCSQGGMNQEMVNDYVYMSGIILFAEMLCDWIKHSFITKFNFIKSSAYHGYALILAGDITGVGQDGINHIDHTHTVVKRIGFAQIPLVCVMARYFAEAARYAVTLSDDGDSNHVLYSMALLLTRGSWSQVATLFISVFIVLLILKGLLGGYIEKKSHAIIFLPSQDSEEDSNVTASGNKTTQRRQAV